MRILIVGAGIAGLAMHRALSLLGLKATVVERSNFAGVGGAALFLTGNAVRALGELGLIEAVIDRSHPILHQRFCDEDGRLRTGANTTSWTPKAFGVTWVHADPSSGLCFGMF